MIGGAAVPTQIVGVEVVIVPAELTTFSKIVILAMAELQLATPELARTSITSPPAITML